MWIGKRDMDIHLHLEGDSLSRKGLDEDLHDDGWTFERGRPGKKSAFGGKSEPRLASPSALGARVFVDLVLCSSF